MATQLAPSDKADFDRLEGVIRAGLQTFVEVGAALLEIKERGLYKNVCSTFEAYVQIRFGFSRSRAYRLIEAVTVVGNLSPIGDIPAPANEAQARPLADLPPEQQREAWKVAVEEKAGAKLTAEDVKRAVAKVRPHKTVKYDKLGSQRAAREQAAERSEAESEGPQEPEVTATTESVAPETSVVPSSSEEPLVRVGVPESEAVVDAVAPEPLKVLNGAPDGGPTLGAYLRLIGQAPEFTPEDLKSAAAELGDSEKIQLRMHWDLIGKILTAAKGGLRVVR